MEQFDLKNAKIAVIGLGYVGLPLAIEFAKKYDVLGFDINATRISDVLNGHDYTNEANIGEFKQVLSDKAGIGLKLSSTAADLIGSNPGESVQITRSPFIIICLRNCR
jgi:UDP-N-acetyl-D-galactosamine dehydrogenase